MKKTAETMRATFSRSDRAALAAAIRAAHNLSKFGGANIDGAAHVKQAARVIKAVRVKPATNSAFSAAAIAARQQAADGAPSCHALAMTIGQPDAGMRREALARVEARRAYRQFDLLVMQAAARLSIGAIRRAYNMSGDDKIRRMLSGLRADIAAMLRADDARTFSDGADVLQAVACALLPYVGEDGSLDLSAIVGLTPKGLPLTVAKVGFRAAHAEIYRKRAVHGAVKVQSFAELEQDENGNIIDAVFIRATATESRLVRSLEDLEYMREFLRRARKIMKPRRYEVLRAMLSGLTQDQISARLGTSQSTVSYHIDQIRKTSRAIFESMHDDD